MKNRIISPLLLLVLGALADPTVVTRAVASEARCVIVGSAKALPLETLAAREVRRYVYLRTGRLLAVQHMDRLPAGNSSPIIVAQKDRPVVQRWATTPELHSALSTLTAPDYWLKTVSANNRTALLVTGGSEVSTLYAAYRLAEHLGVRFYLHGDVVPDDRIALVLPALDERATPLFALRGIQPFHDFPEGPDWWNRDDYLAILSQLPKLRMNFFGLHTYPEGGPNAEPTVWIGQPSDLGENGRAKFSYPSSYQNTQRGNWGYAPKRTSDYAFGAAELFERDDFGAEVMWGHIPQPTTPAASNEVFDRTGAMLRAAFAHARQLGVKTCVGTETPLTVPKLLQERLRAQGKDSADVAVIRELYEGIFYRCVQAYPLDFYWFWTPEGWTWEGTKDEQVKRTTDDLFAAIEAHKRVQSPFRLATCGWVLGPQQDRAMFDKVLPKDIAVSCINREVGRTPVDKGFADVKGRGKWAIPWLEDDPALTSPQLWAGRMRRDAADARRYGCDGLMGIHWRTRVLGPAVSALAQAAWNQDEWNLAPTQPVEPAKVAGAVGGQAAAFPNHPIADTEDAPLYQTVRFNLSAYHLAVPNGAYTVTLKFCEPHYSGAGKRVFGIKLQGKTVLDRLDIFAKVGQNRALDYSYDEVSVTNGWLEIEFVPQVEFPAIAALVVHGANFTQKINCGGPAYKDYVGDWPSSSGPAQVFPPTDDFYRDWARHEFGREVAVQAAAIFAQIDGHLPRPADWVDGPGGIRPDPRPWEQVRKEYGFVDELAALGPEVKGTSSQERFEYWLNTFRYMRAMAQANCLWAEYNKAMEKVKAEKDPAAQKTLARQSALPLRRQLVARVGEVYQHLLATLSTPGELGTVANWEQHILPGLLTRPGEELAKMLGEALPLDAQPAKTYRGLTRVIVPTARTSFAPGEELRLKVIILAERPPREAALYSRPLGQGGFTKTPLVHVARGVYSVTFPARATATADLEYYLQVTSAEGAPVRFPATAPGRNQTLVAEPPVLTEKPSPR